MGTITKLLDEKFNLPSHDDPQSSCPAPKRKFEHGGYTFTEINGGDVHIYFEAESEAGKKFAKGTRSMHSSVRLESEHEMLSSIGEHDHISWSTEYLSDVQCIGLSGLLIMSHTGVSLDKVFDAKDPLVLSNDDIVSTVIQTAKALQHTHKKGIVHMDVKPDNITLNDDGDAKLIDFGIAKRYRDKNAKSLLCGTPMYMGPQQLRGDRPTPANDVWGLGATAIHLLTRELPYAENPFSPIQGSDAPFPLYSAPTYNKVAMCMKFRPFGSALLKSQEKYEPNRCSLAEIIETGEQYRATYAKK